MWKPDKLLTIFLSVSLFILMPFIFSMKLQDVEQSPRFLCMALVVAVSSLFTLIFVFRNSISVKTDKIYIFLSLFLIINFVSFLRTINYGDGLFEFLKLFLFYSLLFQFIIVFSYDSKNKLIFYKAICISTLIFIIYGIIQFIPSILSSLSKGTPLKFDYSIASTLGNKNFFAETLLMMLPVTLLSARCHRKVWRGISVFSALLILISLVLLQTLSTWVALLIAIIFTALFLLLFRNKIFTNPKAGKSFYLGITGIAVALAFSIIVYMKVAGTDQIRSRIMTIEKLLQPGEGDINAVNQNSVYERIMMWQNSVKMIADHPMIGVGLGNWKIYFPSYGMGSATYMTSGGIRFVHPHNDYLLVASESGLIGLAVFLLWMMVLIYYAWYISAKANTTTKLFFGITMLFGLIVYMIISLFSMPMNRIYPLLMLMLFTALIVSEYHRIENSKKALGNRWILLVMILSFVSASGSVVIGIKRLQSDSSLSSALLLERKRNYDAMKGQLEKIDKKYFPLDATATPIAWYQGFSNFYLGNRDTTFTLFKEAEAVNPYHLMVLNDLGTCYNLNNDAKTAVAFYQKALAIQPAFGDALINLAIIYYNSGQIDSAYATLIKHSGKIKPESVSVFSTIILAKASTVTTDDIVLQQLRTRMKNPGNITELLKVLRDQEKGIQAVTGN